MGTEIYSPIICLSYCLTAMEVLHDSTSISLTNHRPCKAKDLSAKAEDLTIKAKVKDSKFVLGDTSRPRTTAMNNYTVCSWFSVVCNCCIFSAFPSAIWTLHYVTVYGSEC